jgi:hypothetical protein
MVAYICSPSYLEGGDHDSMPGQANSQQDPILANKPGMSACACDPSYTETIGRL